MKRRGFLATLLGGAAGTAISWKTDPSDLKEGGLAEKRENKKPHRDEWVDVDFGRNHWCNVIWDPTLDSWIANTEDGKRMISSDCANWKSYAND